VRPSNRTESVSVLGADSTIRYFAHNEVRPSQKEMVEDAIETLLEDGFLLASAPTGIGKTAASLAAAINAQRASSSKLKILFLTGRQSQHKIVIETVRKINQRIAENESPLLVVDLIGRESMCKNVDRLSGKCDCEEGLDRDMRDQMRSALREKMFRNPMHVDDVIKVARSSQICAWSNSREAAKSCDILICDYNHVFIESVREASLPTMGVELDSTILIVDEAHNLPDRVRNGLERRAISRIFRDSRYEVEEHLERELEQIKKTGNELDLSGIEWCKRSLKHLENEMPKWFSAREKELAIIDSDDMRISTRSILDEIDSILNETIDNIPNKEYFQLEKLVSQLIKIRVEASDDDDENEKETSCEKLAFLITTCCQYRDSTALVLVFDKIMDEPRVRCFLLDPGVISGELFSSCRGAILMSGTLFPPDMYADLLRIPNERKITIREYSSPFLSERRPVLIAQNTTSRYTERGEKNTLAIRNHVYELVRNTPGHVALFTQSYSMLDEILEGDFLPWGVRIEKELPRMSKRQVGEMIQRLYQRRRLKEKVLLCGVLSGKLAEGVDYPDNILDAVVCVGLPVPPPSARQDALRDYCEDRFGRDKAGRYSSHQPAVNSILQAIGRPIRKGQDRALVVILEKRLMNRPYKFCLPNSIQSIKTPDEERTSRHTKRFFQRFPEPAIGNE